MNSHTPVSERKKSTVQQRNHLTEGLFVLLFCLVSASTYASCHAVTPSGAGSRNGSNWSNAFAGLPATRVRGDVYYLADGSYGAVNLSDNDSGTESIELRKAQSYDHGRSSDGCSNDISTGWNASTMGSAQAVFVNSFNIGSSYLIVNGNGQQTTPGCGGAPGSTVAAAPPRPTDCGIKIKDLSGGSGGIIRASSGAHDYTFRYTEWLGVGAPSANEDMFMFGAGDGAGPNTFDHVYGHNAGCVYIQDTNGTRTVKNSYFWGTEVQGVNSDGCHGQFEFEYGGTSNGSEFNNVFRDITGTAVWTFAAGSGTNTNWHFYNNVIFNSSPTVSWSPFLSDGVWACINSGVNCNNFTIVQNTILNMSEQSGINNENNGSYTVENNIWYLNRSGTSFNSGTGGTFIQDHNSFLQSSGGPSGTDNIVVTSSIPNPFVNWQVGNFNLVLEGADWDNRLLLSSAYSADAAGNKFTTDRGAYQFSGTQGPNAPSGLTATVQ